MKARARKSEEIAMVTDLEQLNQGIDHEAYNAALSPKIKIADAQLAEKVLKSTTLGGENTLLHLAAGVGNLSFVQQLLRLNSLLVRAKNAQENTALHLAAQGGFPHVVKHLLEQEESGVDVLNKNKETPLFKACESGDLPTVKQLCKGKTPRLLQRTVDERTCLYVAINRGDLDLVDWILNLLDANDLIQEKYKHGDTALHIAVARNDVHIIRRLIENKGPQLCYFLNDNKETPLCMAAKLGHLEAVQELIKWRPDAVEIPNSCGMNVLHLAAQVSQVRIVEYLSKNVFLLDLVNRGLDKPPEEKPPQSREKDAARETDRFSKISEGDTPLHIAARKKCFNMVSSLLRIRGINKFALNKEGLTALDIVRENTQYHESDKIISVLASYPSKRKPFLYSAPKVSAEKHEVAIKTVDKTFDDRRNAELVVAVLLATMSFTAAFTIPGSFVTDVKDGESDKNLGAPILLGLDSFKLFLIFDSVAFFLSLFVVLMWQMSTPITTGNKILFLCATNLLVCATFAFTAYGFMAAMYAMLDRKAHKLAWFILGACLIICGCGNFTFFYMVGKFSVKKARFNHLNGLLPFLPELVGEWMWMRLERWGLLDLARQSVRKWLSIFYCDRHEDMAKKDMADNDESQKDMADNDESQKDTAEKDLGTNNQGKPLSVIHKV